MSGALWSAFGSTADGFNVSVTFLDTSVIASEPLGINVEASWARSFGIGKLGSSLGLLGTDLAASESGAAVSSLACCGFLGSGSITSTI